MTAAIIGSFISAMATVLGALPLLFVKKLSEKWKDVLIAFTAGIMVSATTFGLIPQALQESGLIIMTLGLLTGIIILDLLEKNIPHIDIEQGKGVTQFDSKSLLVIFALFIHNIPEGLSTGFSYASEDAGLGPMIAIAIGAQNMPEGLILGVFLMQSKVSKLKLLLIVTLTGLVEVVSAIIGYFTATYIQALIGYGL